MATILSFLSGRQITDDNGNPKAGAKLYHYQAGTTSALTVYSNQAGTTPHAQPVVCDAGGFAPLIYISDTSDWKVVVTDASDVTLRTYDNLPAAEADESSAGFAPPLFPWTQVTSSASPVALTAADAGKAYEADTTSGNIEFDLPSAASVGNGKGFLFKKIASANAMVIDPNASETTDDVSASISITRQYQAVGIFSNGAEWYKAWEFNSGISSDRLASTFINGNTEATSAADTDEFLLQLASAGAFRKIQAQNLRGGVLATEQATTSGTAFDFTGIGTSAKRIVISFNEVSLSGTDNILVQIGDSGGVETSGYSSSSALAGASSTDANSTSGLIVTVASAARTLSGHMVLTRLNSSNLWTASHSGRVSTNLVVSGGGVKTTSATLDRVRITRTGTDTFDAGSVNIIWE